MNKFRRLRSSAFVEEAPEPPADEDDKKGAAKDADKDDDDDDEQQEKDGKTEAKGDQDPDKTENEVKQSDAEKACRDKGITKEPALTNCKNDVAAVGGDQKTKEEVLQAGKDEEKEDEDVEENQ